MNKQMKFSVLHLILWSTVAILFLVIFVSLEAINNWGDNRIKSIMLAILFLLGFGGDYILRYIFRKKTNEIKNNKIISKALGSSFIATCIYIFVISISIYTKYEGSGFVPVGWL